MPEALVRARARELLRSSQRVLVLTGAGISTDSGIPDFRGPNGVWTRDPEAEKRSNISYYLADPELRRRAWKSRVESSGSRPNPNDGHRAVVAIEWAGRLLGLITQNVDGLHHAAGSDPARIIEIHGTSREVTCLDCGDRAPIERALDRVRAGEDDPACRTCGGILKPATISFGQSLVTADLQRAESLARSCDLLLAVGTTLSVYPIAEVVPIAIASGASVVIVNGEPTAMDDLADVVIQGSISGVLTDLVDGLAPVA